MQYLLLFLEGIITFISPCLLPMLPIYISYFAAGSQEGSRATLKNALGFVAGFTLVFVALGAFAATLGTFFWQYRTALNIITGAIVILFGLNFMGLLSIGFLNRTIRSTQTVRPAGFFSAMVFGIIFSVGWTPCVGVFLGSALLLAGQQGSVIQGIFMLLSYSLGLGIPFLVSALLISRLKSTFAWIKAHYRIINMVSGGLLVLVGILMATGAMGYLLGLLSA